MENKMFCTLVDCSRNGVMKVDQMKRFMDYIRLMGYNSIMLYTEDTIQVENEPFFGYLRGAYTQNEICEIVEHGEKIGMEVIPFVQTLGHMGRMNAWPAFSDLWDVDDILLVDEPRTYEFIRNVFATVRKYYKSNYLCVGMDEAVKLGTGRHLKLHGYEDPMKILLRHMNKVVELAGEFGFKALISPDVFFRLKNDGDYYNPDIEIDDELRAMVPEDVILLYWEYNGRSQPHYEGMIEAHKKFNRELWYMGGVWNWVGFVPGSTHLDNTMVHAMAACREKGMENMCINTFGDDGAECSPFACLDSLLRCRMLYDNEDMSLFPQRFEEIVGMPLASYQKLVLPNLVCGNDNSGFNPTKYALYNDAFAGYFDPNLPDGSAEEYRAYANELAQVDKSHFLGPIFESMEQLCRVMEIKFDLGKRLRKAYQAGDKQELNVLLADMDELVIRLDAFHSAFCKMWNWVYKPYGFEVQDIRLGGLQRRIRTCRDRLADYLNGEIDKIDELEETLMQVFPNTFEIPLQDIWCNSWKKSVTINYL